jgi:hypothetical protein
MAKAGRFGPPVHDCCVSQPDLRGTSNLAAHFVTGVFVYVGQLVLFTAMLLGIAQHLFRTGAARLPIATSKTNVGAAKLIITLSGATLCAQWGFSHLSH